VMSVWVEEQNFELAKEALKRASYKISSPTRIVVDKGAELVAA